MSGSGANANRTILTYLLVHSVHNQPLDSLHIGFWTRPELECTVKAGFEPEFHTPTCIQTLTNATGNDLLRSGLRRPSSGLHDRQIGSSGNWRCHVFLNQPTPGFPAGITKPETAKEYYRLLTGSWKDGTALSSGGLATMSCLRAIPVAPLPTRLARRLGNVR